MDAKRKNQIMEAFGLFLDTLIAPREPTQVENIRPKPAKKRIAKRRKVKDRPLAETEAIAPKRRGRPPKSVSEPPKAIVAPITRASLAAAKADDEPSYFNRK